MTTTSFISAMLALASISTATCAHAEAQVTEAFTLSSEVISQVTPHIAKADVGSLPPLLTRQKILHKGNFGQAIYGDGTLHAAQLENGLYDVRVTQGSQGAGTGGENTSLSLCGLVSLLSVGESRSTISGNHIVRGYGFYTRHTVDFANRRRAILLESSTPSLCSIAPGANFTFRVDSATSLRIEGDFLRDKTIERVISNRTACMAAGTSAPATGISSVLTGGYLEVSCESTDAKGKPTTTRFAYLIDYHYYLLIGNKSKWESSETTYSAAQATSQ